MEGKLIAMVSSYPVIYNLSVNVYRDITKKNKAWKEVSEIVAHFGDCMYFNNFLKKKKSFANLSTKLL